jgi:two-component system cell cycle response regulator
MSATISLDTPTASVTPLSQAMHATLVDRDRGLLIEMSGSSAGRVHALNGAPVTIGRGARCTLPIPDSTLSRTHASIAWSPSEGAYVLVDEGSLNGSFVNRERVTRAVLKHGDRLRFGSGVRLQFQLVNLEEERVLVHMYEAAVLDGLTGLMNRRALDQRLLAEVAHAVRHRRELCALVVDVDHFKRVNDTHGHLVGDEVLRAVAGLMAGAVRCEDILARYGGEEFVVLARDIPLDGAVCLAERLRKAVESEEITFEGTSLKVTVSVGVASLAGVQGDRTGQALIDRADQALYRAKETGRNRTVTAAEVASLQVL